MKLEAGPIENNTQVKVELKFRSNKTDNDSIADDIINELRLSKENISSLIKIDDSYDDGLKSILEAQASVGSNISNIKVDYSFVLNETNRTEIIDSIYNKLSNLSARQILGVLEIKTLQEEIKSEENDSRLDKKDKMDDDKYGTTRKEEYNKRDN